MAPPRAAFLEIGVGCGLYTRWLAMRGKVLAIDINASFLDAVGPVANVTPRLGDITTDRFAPLHDLALCSEVIEHVHDSAAALRHIYASLKPGGHLVLTTPNACSTAEFAARLLAIPMIATLARAITGEAVDDPGHINRLTHRQLREEIDAAGFEVVRQDDLALYLPGIAEFGGNTGLRFCQWLARKLADTRFSFLLWTQCWVLRKPPSPSLD
jgi:2-polyprenyl-3-methyl-5-hydroxy-6-metoxy-1,4-benzoquinol methylase